MLGLLNQIKIFLFFWNTSFWTVHQYIAGIFHSKKIESDIHIRQKDKNILKNNEGDGIFCIPNQFTLDIG